MTYTGPFPFDNTGTIDGILVSHTSFSGDIVDAGAITTSGIRLVDSTITNGGIAVTTTSQNLSGGISVDAGSTVGASSTTGYSIFLEDPRFSGGIYNAGVLSAGIRLNNNNGTLTFSGTLTNTGTISGGSSGYGIYSAIAGISVFDSGAISGTTDAIRFQNLGISNTLTLAAGYSITGNVVGGGNDILQLGGSGSGTFDLTKIGSGKQYQGFLTFYVVGGSWKLTGTGSEGWNIEGGTLELASGASISGLINFANSGGTLQLDTGRSQVSGAIVGAGIGDAIDLRFQAFAAGIRASWSQNTTTTGTLSLFNGATLLTSMALTGNYATAEFQAVSDNNGGTLIQIVAPSKPTLSVTSVNPVAANQTIALSTLVTIADPSGVGYQELELWDSDGTAAGGRFIINSTAQTGGHEIDVTPAQVSSGFFEVGSAAGTDTLWARLLENDGTLTGWQPFTVTASSPTLTVHNDGSASSGQIIGLSSLVTIADPGSASYQKLELWDSDGTTAGGQFFVNGVAQTGGHEIDVAPGATVTFKGGTAGGTDQLWAQVLQNNGTLTGWQPFTVTVPEPTLTVQSLTNQTTFHHIALSQLVTIADPSNVGYQKLELWDANLNSASGGFFVVNSGIQNGGQEIDVLPGNVAGGSYVTESAAGTDTLWAQLELNNGTLTGWQEFTVTVPAPSLTVQSDASATRSQTIALSSLVTISDPVSVGYQKLELWDSDGTAAGGQFFINGAAQTGGHEIDVPSGATVTFTTGTGTGTDTLWAQLELNNGTLTGWQEFTVTVPSPSLTVQSDASATTSQTIALSSLVTISDPLGAGYEQLELWDSNGTAAGGQFFINGAAQTGSHEIDVPSGATVTFETGTGAGTDILWARLEQNDSTTTGWQEFSVTVPAPTLVVQSGTESKAFTSTQLVSVSDPGNVGYQKLELWDSSTTTAGGYFTVNGVAQSGGQEIDVLPGATVAHVSSMIGGTEQLWARLLQNDGTLTGWQLFTVAVQQPTLSVQNDSTATEGHTIGLSSLVTISDSLGVGYQTLELWDSDGTAAGGQFFVNGAAQTGGHEIDVAPGATVTFEAGTAGGTDVLWAQLLQNDGTLTGWKQFTVTTPAPTLSVSNDAAATASRQISVTSLVTISDPGNQGYQTLELWDSDGTAAGGQFFVNGVAQAGGHEIDVSPADVANTMFDPGTSAGSDILWARLQQNDGTLTAWQQFTVTTPVPTLSVTNYAIATANQQISLADLVTVSDPGGENYQALELRDSNGTAAGGQFFVQGVAQTGTQEIDLSLGALTNTEFTVGSTGASDILYARLLQNDGTLTPWQEFTVTGNTVAAGGTQELVFASGSPMTFAGSTGTLQLDNSASFTGTVAGMTGQDTIDFRDINFATIQTPTLLDATGTGATLHVTDGTHTANIALLGNYLASTFVASSDGHGGTSVIDPPANQASVLTQPAHA